MYGGAASKEDCANVAAAAALGSPPTGPASAQTADAPPSAGAAGEGGSATLSITVQGVPAPTDLVASDVVLHGAFLSLAATLLSNQCERICTVLFSPP